MRISALTSLAIAGAALVVPAISLGAGSLTPASGSFAGTTSPYKSFHKQQTAKVTLTVRGGKISGFVLKSKLPPFDAKHSHGNVCGAINEFLTKGYTASGSVSARGAFSYAFTRKQSSGGKVLETDTITIKGSFTDASHVKGTFRDVLVSPHSSPLGASHCDTGTVAFTASHS